MILLIDNYDSFSYNLYQLTGSITPDIKVLRNDAVSIDEIRRLDPEGIIISPGPGRPENAGICTDIVLQLGADIPILGVCLGHQVICTAFGAVVSYARELMHGKQSMTVLDTACPLFKNCPEVTPVARYHSLGVVEETLPETLKVCARTQDGEVMAVQHNKYNIYGVQFHPESIMTPNGHQMLENFISITKKTMGGSEYDKRSN